MIGRDTWTLGRRAGSSTIGFLLTNCLLVALTVGVAADLHWSTPAWAAETNRARPLVVIVDTRLRPGRPSKGLRQIRKVIHEMSPLVRFRLIGWPDFDARIAKSKDVALVLLSPQGDPWWEYPEGQLDQLKRTVREATVPMLGICGGHQLLALSFGGSVGPVERLRPGKGYDGLLHIKGWMAVVPQGTTQAPIIPANCQVHESHREEVKTLGPDLVLTATSAGSKVEALGHAKKPIWGVQFHPETWDADHACGREVLIRILSEAGVTRDPPESDR